MQEQASLVNY
jgi:hypothetical protein